MLFTWLKRYVDFAGRSSRKEFWFGVLGMLIIIFASHIVDAFLFSGMRYDGTGPASMLVALAVLVPSFALQIRRLHDIGRTGWWVLLGVIPIIGGLVLLFWALQPGQPTANKYGAPPPETPGLSPSEAETVGVA